MGLLSFECSENLWHEYLPRMPVEVFELAMYLLCNQQLVRNPFLISKLVDVLCACCPTGPQGAQGQGPPPQLFLHLLNNRVLLDPRNDLVASLVVFWSNVELTGALRMRIYCISYLRFGHAALFQQLPC